MVKLNKWPHHAGDCVPRWTAASSMAAWTRWPVHPRLSAVDESPQQRNSFRPINKTLPWSPHSRLPTSTTEFLQASIWVAILNFLVLADLVTIWQIPEFHSRWSHIPKQSSMVPLHEETMGIIFLIQHYHLKEMPTDGQQHCWTWKVNIDISTTYSTSQKFEYT